MKTAVLKSGNGKRRSTVNGKQNNKLDCYERFTQLILEKLEQGVDPWRKVNGIATGIYFYQNGIK